MLKPTPSELLKYYNSSQALLPDGAASKLLQAAVESQESALKEQKAAAFDLIAKFVHGGPFLSEIAWVSRPAFPTGKAEAQAMNTNGSLVHRAMGERPHLLQTIISSPHKHDSKPHDLTTAQLQDANSILNTIVPANSAHLRKATYSIIGLYRRYAADLKSPLPPLNEEYFRKLVHELGIICNVESQACPLCDLWESSNNGLSLSADIYGKCQAHFRTVQLQRDSYYNFLHELQQGTLGLKMLGDSYSGAVIVFDFGQLDPSTKRHKDGVLHFWLAPELGCENLRSIPFHYLGGEASDQPASVAFAVDCIKHAATQLEVKDLNLLVFFSDGGPKEFNSDLIACLPMLEKKIGKRIIWNYWAANHGAGVADTDQQNARESLNAALPEKKVINDTSIMIEILAKNQPGAKFFDATSFSRSIDVPALPKVSGISLYHCFKVADGSVVGFHDSWTLSHERDFSLSCKVPSNQQEYLKARHDAGMGVSHCKLCDVYYVDRHSCKRSNDSVEVTSGTKKSKIDLEESKCSDSVKKLDMDVEVSKAESKGEQKRVDVYHEDGLWYCGKLVKECPKTCQVDFIDGDHAGRVLYRDVLDCIHNPQLKVGSNRGLPEYLTVNSAT
jgi:hypothetical protein